VLISLRDYVTPNSHIFFFFTFFFIEFLDLCYSKYINDAYYNPNASIDHVQGKL